MSAINVTFQELGQPTVTLLVSADLSQKLDRFVADSSGKYTSKLDLFVQFVREHLIGPIDKSYPSADPTLLNLASQISSLQTQLTALKGTPGMTVAAPTVTVTPAKVSLAAGANQQFLAAVTGAIATLVTWSLVGPGAIDANGLFTAPAPTAVPGAATTVTATASDGKTFGTATVTLV